MSFRYFLVCRTLILFILIQNSLQLSGAEFKCSTVVRALRPDLFTSLERVLKGGRTDQSIDHAHIDRSIETQVVAWVGRSSRLYLSGQALDLFQSQIKAEDAVVDAAIEGALMHQRAKPIGSASMLFRFLGPEHNKELILIKLRENIIARNYITKEADLASVQKRPQLFGETTLDLNGEKITFRFGILLPKLDHFDPVVTLLAPRIDNETSHSIIATFRDPWIPDWLVLRGWKNGVPQQAAVVPYRVSSLLRPVAQIKSGFLNYYLNLVQSREARQLRSSFSHPEAMLKSLLQDAVANQEISIAYKASTYLKARYDLSRLDFERALLFKARDFLLNRTQGRDRSPQSSAFYFPSRFSEHQVTSAFYENIKRGSFRLYRSQDIGGVTSINGETSLVLDGSEYPVNFSLSHREGEKGVVIEGLHATHKVGMNNDILEVFYDDTAKTFIVASSFRDGIPEQAVVLDPNGQVVRNY